MAGRAGRTTRNFDRLRSELRRRGLPCWICRQPIDYSLSFPDPEAFTADHIKPLSTHPHLAEEPTNLAAAHFRCNNSRKASAVRGLGATSREW